MQKRSNDSANENNGNKSSTDVKGSMPTRDKSLDERSDKSVNIISNETSGNSQRSQNGVKKKIYLIGDSMIKHIKG